MAADTGLSQEALALIGVSIRSVWTLEVLRLMSAAPGRLWREHEILRELRASTAVVREAIDSLSLAGLVQRGEDGEAAYAPRTGALDRVAGELVQVFRERPVAVIKAIALAPDARIRTFADAFRIVR